MKEICKKILSGVLCASLIVTPIMQPNDSKAAESTTVTATVKSQSTADEIQFALSEKPVNQLEDKELKFTYESVKGAVLYLRNATAFKGIGASKQVYPLDEWSGIWLNNTKLESGYTFATNVSDYPVFYAELDSITPKAGDCMVIRGAWENYPSTYRFHMATVTYEYNGTQWIAVDTPDVVIEEGGSDLQASVVPTEDKTTLYLDYPNMKNVLGMSDNSYDPLSPVGSNSGIYVDGKKVEGRYIHGAGWGITFYIKAKDEDSSYEVTETTTIRIQGTWSYNNKYVSLKTQQFKYTGNDKNPWVLDESYVEETANEVCSGFTGTINYNGAPLKDTEGNSVKLQISDLDMTSAKITLPKTATEGDVVSVGGLYANNVYTITLKESSWKWNGSAWETYIPTTKVTVAPYPQAGSADTVYVQVSGMTTNQKYSPEGGSVKLDGTVLQNVYELDYVFNYAGWSNVHYIKLTHYDTSKAYTFKEGSILTIEGIFKGANDGTLIEIPETKLVCNADYTLSVYTEKIDLTAPTISLTDSTIRWDAVTNATAYEIYANGVKKADTTETSYNLKNLKLGVGEYQITVKAVAENANPATSNTVVYNVTATKVQVSVSDVNARNSNNKVLYLQVPSSLTDGKFAPVDGYVRLNGVELRYYVDGWPEIEYAFNRDSSELYVIQLTSTNYVFSDKAILTIGGTFEGTDGMLIDIEETHLVCEMKKNAEDKDVYDWTDVSLTMEGDLSGNGKWDMIDLIRMKRYIADGIATAYLNVTDINKDGKADADDVAILRGCIVGNTTMSDGQVTGKYLADKTLNIFADGPVEQTVESQLKQYFNAGFTTVQMTQDYVAMNESLTDNKGTLNSAYVNAIKTAMKYGDVMVRNHGSKADYFTADTFKQLYDLGVRQFYIWDEPLPHTNDKSADWDSVRKLAEAFNTLPEDTLFHVNLLPSYGPMKTTGWFWEETLSHTGYVNEYTDAISTYLTKGQEYTVSLDNYPLLADKPIRESYLTDLWTVANKAKSLGDNATVNFCIQTYNEKSNKELRVPETRADISFQTNVGLALGAQSFEYFEYYDWSAEDAITGILTNGLYDEVKSVNRELLAWDHVFMAFDWQGIKTYNVDEAYTNGITQLKELQKVYVSTGSEDDATVVGEYKYTKGNDTDYGYMITNFTDPSQEKTATVIVELVDSADKVLVYKNGVGTYMKPDGNNKITIKLGAGEGAFVIVD